MRVKASSSGIVICVSGPMISCTSPPEQKLPPAPRDDHRLHVARVRQRAEQVAQLGVRLERQRILALGAVERDRRDALVDLPAEMVAR